MLDLVCERWSAAVGRIGVQARAPARGAPTSVNTSSPVLIDFAERRPAHHLRKKIDFLPCPQYNNSYLAQFSRLCSLLF